MSWMVDGRMRVFAPFPRDLPLLAQSRTFRARREKRVSGRISATYPGFATKNLNPVTPESGSPANNFQWHIILFPNRAKASLAEASPCSAALRYHSNACASSRSTSNPFGYDEPCPDCPVVKARETGRVHAMEYTLAAWLADVTGPPRS